MSVFTIYCHGTGGHRDKDDSEIVAFMGRRAKGTEYADYLILDGVAGKPKNKSGLNPMAGSFNCADRGKSAKGRTPKELGGGHSTTNSVIGRGVASASGEGVEDNARHAIVTIADVAERYGLPDTINLVGWSRGAVTCLVIANMLYDPTSAEGLFRTVKVNIFAVDPVAGQEAGHGKDAESRRLVPPSVRNYLGILATGENRETFKPQDLSRVQVVDAASTNLMFLPFPGKHSTVAKSDDATKEVSSIIFTLAHRFFDKFGSHQRDKPSMLANGEMLERYSGIVVRRSAYGKIKQKGAVQWLIGGGITGGGFGKRDVASNLDQYTRSSAYFVNEHHRVLFEALCPALYEWLFEPAKASQQGLTGRTVDQSHAIGREVVGARGVRPDFIESLGSLGVELNGSWVKLPAPGSSYDPRAVHNLQARGSLTQMGVL
jgi:uncharacterized protein DUF5621